MRKQVLVTVDRGETRVAMLEASGEPEAPTKSRGRSRRGGLRLTGMKAGCRSDHDSQAQRTDRETPNTAPQTVRHHLSPIQATGVEGSAMAN